MADPSGVRVFLVDDHEVVRRGVAEVLEEDPGITVAGEAGTVAEALARVPAVRPVAPHRRRPDLTTLSRRAHLIIYKVVTRMLQPNANVQLREHLIECEPAGRASIAALVSCNVR